MGGTSNCFSIAPSNQDPTSSVVDSTHLTCVNMQEVARKVCKHKVMETRFMA